MLPSQNARPKSSRSHMYRRTRRRRWPMLLGLAGALGAAGMVFSWWSGGQKAATATAAASGTVARSTAQKPSKPQSPAASTQSPAVAAPSAKSNQTTAAKSDPPPVLANAAVGPTAPAKSEPQPKPQPPPQPPPASQPSNPAMPLLVLGNPPAKTAAPPSSKPPPLTNQSTRQAPANQADDNAQRTSQRIKTAVDLIAQNKPIEARTLLSAALHTAGLSPADSDRIRTELGKLNDRILFGPGIIPGDTLCETYTVQSGDALSKLPRKLGLHTDYLLIKRINGIQEDRIRVGQKLKVIKGPFHAIVYKPDFRLDLYLGDPRKDPNCIFIKSFRVGLGEHDATPEGLFLIKPHSKLINPAWANPRTGEQFDADDPKNPLGEYWIGLIGAGENIRGLEGYGIHGTIEPDSIGQMKSMGCVRLLHDDVALLYELMADN
ncbi:MAG: L,D-transpeptidase family protein, partial [Phycisphaerales bacterium]|nr:L,D-transpeptidase family protein [Phycisphaerales bacterium]